MPKKYNETIWSKPVLKNTTIDSRDVQQIKDAINAHRSFISGQSEIYHNNLLNGNYDFSNNANRGNIIKYETTDELKKAINAFYYGDGYYNKPYVNFDSKKGQIITPPEYEELKDRVNYIETNCTSCDTCQFATWSGNWSAQWTSNWSGDWSGDWSGNWSGAWSGQWTGQWTSNWSGQWTSDMCPACPDATWSGAWHGDYDWSNG